MSTTLVRHNVDLPTAVKTAMQFFRESFRTEKVSDVQLEEIELSENERHWLITVGYENPTAEMALKGGFLVRREVPPRKYKVVKVDARTGRPSSIKIRPGL